MPHRDPAAAQTVIRPGRIDESDEIAILYARVREQTLADGSIPQGIHTLAEHQAWVRDRLFTAFEVWVAEHRGALVGFLVIGRPDWLEHLYLDAAYTGSGLGTRFVELAKRELGGPVQLWTFESNEGARRFYERHEFVAVERTAGDNEERAPDIRYLYTPARRGQTTQARTE